uniref:Uncharacterized protein n=1 Tax=Anopheles minimus TaxID=112268 RepID=A0A182W3B4_9DIPT
MLFDSECAFFMSAAAAASTANRATFDLTEATNGMTMSSSSFSKDVTFSNGFFDLEQPHLLVHDPLMQKQTDYRLVLQPKQTAVQQAIQPQVPQQEQAQQQQQQQQQHQKQLPENHELLEPTVLERTSPLQPMEADPKQQCINNDQSPAISISQDLQKTSIDQPELQQQKPTKKKPISKLKQRSAEELSTSSKMTTDSDHPKSASAPEATNAKSKATSTKSKTSSSNGAEPKKISPKTRKASLASIIYRQLMAAGGLGLGVGIDKTVPIPPRQRPPVRQTQGATSTSKPTAVKKSSNKTSSTSSKAISSDSSGDPIPEHFGSANGEIATTIAGNNAPVRQRVRLDAEQLEFMCSIFIHRISPLRLYHGTESE